MTAAFIEAAIWHGTLERAEAILAAHPEVATSGIHVAAVLGDDAAVRRYLAEDRASATATSPPYGGDALNYLGLSKYLRLDRSRTGALSKAGSRTLRWAAVEAAHAAWRSSNPWHQHYAALAQRAGKNPAKSAVARKVLTASWHILSRGQPFKPARSQTSGTDVSASSSCFLAA